jgi:IS5 family transposase
MKAHIGVDVNSGRMHTKTTGANEADVEQVEELLHGKEAVVQADAGYSGADKRVERKGLRWEIAAKRGKVKAMKDGRQERAIEKREKHKARSTRADLEFPASLSPTPRCSSRGPRLSWLALSPTLSSTDLLLKIQSTRAHTSSID